MSAVMTDWIPRHRITVDEFYKMAEAGIFAPDARVELIEGEIIDMSLTLMGTEHVGTVAQLSRLLIGAAGDAACVLSQSSIRLNDLSAPMPDFVLAKPRADFYKKKRVVPEDMLLVIEVSDSSLRYDSQVKAPLYARYGIPEYWLIDIPGRQVRYFRSPDSGRYTDITSTETPGVVSPVALPDVRIDLARLLDD